MAHNLADRFENEDGFGYEPGDSFDTIDMFGQPCEECGKDLYEETTVNDDKNGVLHCPKCNHEVPRWKPVNEDMVNADIERQFNFDNDPLEKDAYYREKETSQDWTGHYERMLGNEWEGMTDYGYGTGSFKSDPNYVFDPKNPPVWGCTEMHPPLNLDVDGVERQVYGSSCMNPNIDDADLYISLDLRAPLYAWEQPWEDAQGREHIRFFIPDRDVPRNPEQFDMCVDYAVNAITEGKKVHIGCISGHGRTGMFLSAIVHKVMGEKLKEDNISAIDYVRDNYCARVVETLPQVLFLHAQYGIDVPVQEEHTVADFKRIFQQQNADSFENVVAIEGFNELVADIEMIEKSVRRDARHASVKKPAQFNAKKLKKLRDWKKDQENNNKRNNFSY